jgi:hypothetical protein
MMKMPTIRKLNLIDQYTLDNAELAIAGLWQSDDNAVLNADSVTIEPGTIVPINRNSRGLMSLQPGSNIEFGHIAIQDYEREIRQAFFSMDLGPTNKTPMSATEVAERQSQLARRIGAPFTRLMQNGLMPLVQRITKILEDDNRIEIPKVNGKQVVVQSHSPLAAAQKLENARQIMDWKGAVDYVAGPLAPAYINLPPVLSQLTNEFEVPSKSLRDEEDAAQLVRGIYEQFTAGGQGPANGGTGEGP